VTHDHGTNIRPYVDGRRRRKLAYSKTPAPCGKQCVHILRVAMMASARGRAMKFPHECTRFIPHERVIGDRRDQLGIEVAARYAAGATIRQLARSTGRSYGSINRLLVEYGGEVRTRGGPNRLSRTTTQ
jgi:hypothetical protein